MTERHISLTILGGVGLIALHFLLGPSEEPGETSLAPLVADLAPTLVLPVSMNESVDQWMERYLTDQRPVFERYLAREGLYSGMHRIRVFPGRHLEGIGQWDVAVHGSDSATVRSPN